ncbi:hypothetical protein Tco_0641333, partial [Tanacetum coccineum]
VDPHGYSKGYSKLTRCEWTKPIFVPTLLLTVLLQRILKGWVKIVTTTLSFKPTLENEVLLMAHMCTVANLSPEPIKSLIPPSGEVNADDSADKSSSETSVQPVTQPKAPTDKKPRKKKIPSSTKPKSSKQVRDVPPKKQVVETQPAEEPVATANITQRGRGKSKGYPRPNRESESALNALNFLYTLCLHSWDDTGRFLMPEVDPENSILFRINRSSA